MAKRHFNRGRNYNRDENAILKKELESIKRENKRLRKLVERMDLGHLFPEENDEENSDLKRVKPTFPCRGCGGPAKLWKLPLRSGDKKYTICERCGTKPL